MHLRQGQLTPCSIAGIGERPSLVIFDAFNTIVTSHPDFCGTFFDGLAQAGLDPSLALLADLQAASEGIAHVQWSVSRTAYQNWARETLHLVGRAQASLPPALASRIVPALEQLHQAPMVAMRGAEACLATLKASGFRIAVCSNWGWDLHCDFQSAGLASYIDYFVPSARAGYRKPHPCIYEAVLTASATRAENAVFVGDNIRADVEGPQRAGIQAIHLTSSPVASFTGDYASSLAVVADILGKWLAEEPVGGFSHSTTAFATVPAAPRI